MINHHPADDLLLSHVAGTLAGGPALLVATHIETCAQCQAQARMLEAVGGAMLEEMAPSVLAAEALARTLAAIDAPGKQASEVIDRARRQSHRDAGGRGRGKPVLRPTLPEGMHWPEALEGCDATRWMWFAPGMHMSRVTLPHDPAAKVFLLRIGAGRELPCHTHSDNEMTQVLYGAFHDGISGFGPGDFDEADCDVHHQPRVQTGECICLAAVDGNLKFDGLIARWMGSLVGM